MINQIEKIKGFRLYLLHQINDLTIQQLNTVPAGHNNNVVWNLGHMLAVSMNLTYLKAGLPLPLEEKYVLPYLPGTKPTEPISEAECNQLRYHFIDTLRQLQIDYRANAFVNYSPPLLIPKVYGFEVNSVDDAMDYLLYHEGLHSKTILSIKGGC